MNSADSLAHNLLGTYQKWALTKNGHLPKWLQDGRTFQYFPL